MSDFHAFATRAHERFNHMSEGELFVVDIDGDALWAAYLAAFPAGTDPIYKVNTEHTCSCCKQFIRNIGNVIAISADGKRRTIWDLDDSVPAPYDTVAAALDKLVRNAPIVSVFRPTEPSYGAEQSRQLLEDGTVKVWKHFHAKVFTRHLVKEPATKRGELNTTAQVFERGLKELKADALAQVMEMISSNALYRGEEHKSAVQEFIHAQNAYNRALPPHDRADFVWANIGNRAARFRNTVIGTLVTDISDGVDMETAVKSFETKVAPTNYKRPTALITPRMVDDAIKKLEALDLQDSLTRRFANIHDVSVNDVLWVDNADRVAMKGDVRSLLMAAASTPSQAALSGAAIEIPIEQFMREVVPVATSMDMLVKNAHLGNFVSLTAPADERAARLFKWDNCFGWSYDGNITDSIRERVKLAGGNVEGKLRFSLAWDNMDDLDLHVHTPNRSHIYYAMRTGQGGQLDVDANGQNGLRENPVENVAFQHPVDGFYLVVVHQYSKRQTNNVGFTLQAATPGQVLEFKHPKAVGSGAHVVIGQFEVRNGAIVGVRDTSADVEQGSVSKQKWGISTETEVRVRTLMYSPNYWGDNAVGNKHYIFMLEGCKNDQPTRGIYNEFLRSEFEPHRKVFEVLGDKTKCPVVDDQLSGLGFSSTKGDSVMLRVRGDGMNRLYKVVF